MGLDGRITLLRPGSDETVIVKNPGKRYQEYRYAVTRR
jgi:hypothetical protein